MTSDTSFSDAGELLRAVIEVLPAFDADWHGGENYFRHRDGAEPSHCAVFLQLTGFVLEHWPAITEAQRRGLFAIAERCLASGVEPQSTAAETCFFENLTDEECSPEMRQYLGPASEAYFDEWQDHA